VGIVIWQNAGFRDRAMGLARQNCERLDVQLLDDTVSLKALRVRRDARGNPCLARRYEFEFTSTGERRHRGELLLMGTRLAEFELEPHRLQ
jgi:hypothetical protein